MIIFYIKSLLLSASVLLFVGVTTYMIDPSHIFDSENLYEKEIATYLLQGRNAANVVNYNGRMVQRFFIEGLSESMETVIIGSSHSMQIGENIVKGKSVYNASMSGGALEDYIAIYSMLKINNKLPKRIILHLDHYILNSIPYSTRWKANEDYYQYFLESNKKKSTNRHSNSNKSLKVKRLAKDQMLELFSPSYFQASIKHIDKGLYPTDELTPAGGMVSYTGMYLYPKPFREASALEVEKKVSKELSKKRLYHFYSMNSLDEGRMDLLRKMVRDVKKQKIDLILFLAPFHPRFYDRFLKNTPVNINDVEVLYTKFAKEEEVEIIGSYSPYRQGFEEGDFWDAYHPKRASMEKMFKDLKKRRPDLTWIK